MGREYAVLSGGKIISRTAGFNEDSVSESVPLSDGKTLLIAGEDPERTELLQKLREAEKTIDAK